MVGIGCILMKRYGPPRWFSQFKFSSWPSLSYVHVSDVA